MRLRDAKTGPRTVQLSPGAAAARARAPRVEGNPHVVPGMRPGSRMGDLQRPWERIRKRAGLDGLWLHDCRHSFASRALALGESLPTIGKLLGHSHIQTTARYAHLARDSVHESARRVFARFLDDERICLTNNAAERALRGIALSRKSWLFCGPDRGGGRAAAMYTLIGTAKLINVDPQAWLADALGRIAETPQNRLHELLPWNWVQKRKLDRAT